MPGSEVRGRNVVYRYNDADKERLTSLTNVSGGATYASYSYDAAGNITHREYASGEAIDLVYDGLDQLRRATKKVNGVTQAVEEYWYDGEGKRTQIVKRTPSNVPNELIWFIGQSEAHYTGDGILQHVYAHQTMGTPVSRTDRLSQSTVNLELTFHGLGDSTLAAIDQSGAVNASFAYSPFGELVETTNGGAANGSGLEAHRRRFNDKYADEVSGLSYYGARYYDPISMGWTQSDPKYRFTPDAVRRTPRETNLYLMVLGNPLRYRDPDGRNADAIAPAAQAALVAAGMMSGAPVAIAGAVMAVSLGPAMEATKDLPGNNLVNAVTLMGGGLVELEVIRRAATNGPPPTENDGPKIPPLQHNSDESIKAAPKGGGGGRSGGGTGGPGGAGGAGGGSGGGGRVRGDRMSEDTSLDDALDQLDGISDEQTKSGQNGGDRAATIQSIEKSRRNVQNRFDRIKSSTDIDVDTFEDVPNFWDEIEE